MTASPEAGRDALLQRIFWMSLVVTVFVAVAFTLLAYGLRVLILPTNSFDLFNLLLTLTGFLVDPVIIFLIFYKIGSTWGSGNETYVDTLKFGFAGSFLGGALGFVITLWINSMTSGSSLGSVLAGINALGGINILVGLVRGAVAIVFVIFTAVLLGQRYSNRVEVKPESSPAEVSSTQS